MAKGFKDYSELTQLKANLEWEIREYEGIPKGNSKLKLIQNGELRTLEEYKNYFKNTVEIDTATVQREKFGQRDEKYINNRDYLKAMLRELRRINKANRRKPKVVDLRGWIINHFSNDILDELQEKYFGNAFEAQEDAFDFRMRLSNMAEDVIQGLVEAEIPLKKWAWKSPDATLNNGDNTKSEGGSTFAIMPLSERVTHAIAQAKTHRERQKNRKKTKRKRKRK